jgi:pimeloyl-ACP methyl ester carboxylesterase
MAPVRRIAQDALDLADALGWQRFAVVGHDWGSRAAYVLAAVEPQRVRALAIGYTPHGQIDMPSTFLHAATGGTSG